MKQRLKNLLVLGGIMAVFDTFFLLTGRNIAFFNALSYIISMLFFFLSVLLFFDYPVRFVADVQRKCPRITTCLTHIGWGPYVILMISIVFSIVEAYSGENLLPEFVRLLSAKILEIYYFVMVLMLLSAIYKILKSSKDKKI